MNPARIEHTDLVRPEGVMLGGGCSTQPGDRTRGADRLRIGRLAHDPHAAILGDRARRPTMVDMRFEPGPRRPTVNMVASEPRAQPVAVGRPPLHPPDAPR